MNTLTLVLSGLLAPATLSTGTSIPGSQAATEPIVVEESEAAPWWRSLEMKPVFPSGRAGDDVPPEWKVIGGPANYAFEEDPEGELILHGSGNAPRNAFLVDPTITGDFLLEFDVLIERDGGNSGTQIRSRVDGDRMVGYQIEIDPSARSWSGGLYDEGRRGWIASLADNLEARNAFIPGKWNQYTILAIGPRIRTWINGVPAVDHLDFTDPVGRIGFQVHGGRCDVRWRRLLIADLGTRTPDVFSSDLEALSMKANPSDGIRRTGDGDGFHLTGEDVVLESTVAMPEAPTTLGIAATLRRGSMRIEMGDARTGPGYIFTVPAPIGSSERPGMIRVVRSVDGMSVLIDDVPLVPGPKSLDGPLDLTIRVDRGTIGTVHRMVIEPPTSAEARAIERWRTKMNEPSGTAP